MGELASLSSSALQRRAHLAPIQSSLNYYRLSANSMLKGETSQRRVQVIRTAMMDNDIVGRKARIVAFYLPQYHPIPENDEWWGPGFTEWINVAKARPMFRDHYQPRLPANLGFYDLRLPETRLAQAELARAHGVEAFCYWHYWFAGRRLLERPFAEVLSSKEPNFPFCLGWANQTWTGIWHGLKDKVLIAQTYPGRADYERHFAAVLPAFRDPRYLTVEGKPLFYVYCPLDLPNPHEFTDIWRELALKAGLKGLYLVGRRQSNWDPKTSGFDSVVDPRLPPLTKKPSWIHPRGRLRWEWMRLRGLPTIHQYADVFANLITDRGSPDSVAIRHPCLVPNWDNTPRNGVNGVVLHESTPALFQAQVRLALDLVTPKPFEHRLVFLKSWNEWAEGNYMEPDRRFGLGYLEALRREVSPAE